MSPVAASPATVSRAQTFQDVSAGFFIASIVVLSFVSILGVWKIFGSDVIVKSFSTLGLLAIVAVAIILAGRYFDKSDPALTPPGAPAFKSIRQITLGVLIIAAAGFALLGVLAIWEVITDHQTVFRSLSSLAIVGFAALIVVMVCLERENNQTVRRGGGALVILLVIVAWILLSFFHY
jgi:hypothetical protein